MLSACRQPAFEAAIGVQAGRQADNAVCHLTICLLMQLYVEITASLYASLIQWIADGVGSASTGAAAFTATNIANLQGSA